MAENTTEAPPPSASEARGLVFDIDKFAIHDGPGIRTTVFLKGCPLRCHWCHSPESQFGRPQLLYVRRKCNGCTACLAACSEGAIRLGSVPVDPFAVVRARTRLPASVNGKATASVTGMAAVALPETDELPVTVEVDWARCTNCGACAEECFPGALRLCGEWRTAEDVVAEVAKDEAFFRVSGGGVTLTGGEVTQQSAFAYRVLGGCKSLGIHTAVETAGLAPWRAFALLAEVTDLFLFDLKHMDDGRHRELTGAPNNPILENLRRLAAGRHSGAPYEIVVRVPCIPGLNDDDENVEATASFVRELGLRTLHLLPYNASAAAKYEWIGRPYALGDLPTQSAAYMEHLASLVTRHGLAVQVGG